MNNLGYYEIQQCSQQWRIFLHAFASQFSSKAEPAELRAFMHDLGRTMAQSLPVTDGSSLPALAAAMNVMWAQLNWGWVELIEEADSLQVAHHASPLKAAFGEAALEWSPALIEGIYAQWFEGLGMDPSLHLVQRGAVLEDGQLFVYELKKQHETPAYFTRR
ncbi:MULTISPECIES: cellulose biosynthesis protein BcsD [unclassified Undibacterium]|uniref:cellulose biosynthesis protein BcsD n=1 Tax=unclassified Undibacterium TaxID=2630295 RepID=UPI002AC9279C|nr:MULTISPECIES: cellulose biosynthesis protein BcsD [unclassified Undibacterium]MEB0137554.1 cellulose biosynthesis protein BcsD [Undibacterium sp. CCC2.1]MEB0170555.1 cellulose biosynthesis protein BcsD [Undibacterium sp. CCC1.1]MEB0174496.1 cellulose biosynthesis protein BcsD [Undibacterium sp. CCC3.4]MEB0213707.1 cellulose biosynthesis protein BcsD [Undibacterium sp. 5I2]WPX43872.1 cellulose biosynthesis protein BcsD [Undibacterium sp. CCC3.4]